MYNYTNCPVGADNPMSPWNQTVPNERKFNMVVSQVLSKELEVLTNDYNPGYEEEVDGYSTDNTNWGDVYHDNDHYTPLQLILLFKEHLKQEMLRFGDAINKKRYAHLIEECSRWDEDEVFYTEA